MTSLRPRPLLIFKKENGHVQRVGRDHLSAYDLQLTDALQDLLEQVQVEHVPTEKEPET